MLHDTIELRADARPRLTSIVLLRGDRALAEACLAALARCETGAVPSETILVVQPSDELRRLVTGRVTGARTIWTDVDLGTAASWNLACASAQAPFVALLHEDTVVRAGWQAPLIACLEGDPRVGVVGPQLENPDGSLQNCGWVIARDGGTWQVDATSAPAVAAGAGPLAVDLVSSACMAFDRLLWERLGGFDERFFPAIGVEIDFALATWATGRAVLCLRDIVVAHGTGAMVRSAHHAADTELRHFLIPRNNGMLAAKWRDWLADHPSCSGEPEELRALAAARLERRRSDIARPSRPPVRSIPAARRSVTDGATVGDGGTVPQEVGARASAARADIMLELAAALSAQRDDARAETARLTERLAAEAGRVGALEAEAAVLRERSVALDMVLNGGWWRLRGTVLGVQARALGLLRRLRRLAG